MSATAIEVFRSTRRPDCDERAFVLAAIGITSTIHFDGLQFVLEVDAAEAARAATQLGQYELERRPAPPPPPPPPHHPYAWVGCIVYVVTLVAIGLIVSNGLWRLDAFDIGALDAGRVQSGQWWRAWTALTLHLDGAHLAANLVAGVWFCYLAAAQIGSGSAWFLIVTGAACANLLEALLGPPTHLSVGASTAVFTALGLLAAHSWRLRSSYRQRWAVRWAPLVGGVVLLGWFGSGGGEDPNAVAQIDIVAHAAGFVVGCMLGALVAQPWARQTLARAPQWLSGLAALASIAIAWACALAS
ncbi:MAG: rhomboid family intramembrane serine protease [Steroidobacteraceae bacterium]|jgi:membrane associated rhomboid family serine protease